MNPLIDDDRLAAFTTEQILAQMLDDKRSQIESVVHPYFENKTQDL